MGHVLAFDCSSGAAFAERDFGSDIPDLWVEFDVAFDSTFISDLLAASDPTDVPISGFAVHQFIGLHGGVLKWKNGAIGAVAPASPIVALQAYHIKLHFQSGLPRTDMWVDGSLIGSDTSTTYTAQFFDLFEDFVASGGHIYYDNFTAGTTEGGTSLGTDNFEGGSLAFWNDGTNDASIITDPGIAPPVAASAAGAGRVLIAFDDGPLVASPTWTRIDDTANLVKAIDISVGRQTLTSQTDTGTATVYINDTTGVFDPQNGLSPYFGKLDGRQILIQVYNPVTATWESRFRGLIDDYGYVIDPASDHNGHPILANVQIDCVDVLDYLAGYGLTPGLDGVTAPAGSEGTVYYAATVGNIDDRAREVFTDVGIDSTMYVVFDLNVSGQETKYDADESALVVLRDIADADFPFIANLYADRFGRACIHGRESRFDPATVATGAGTATWIFNQWKVGDGAAVGGSTARAQIRVLEYSRARSNIINAAICYPKGIADADIPGQVYADTTSIGSYGKHTPPGGPITDLVLEAGTTTGNTKNVECQKYAELLVKNQKDPRTSITSLQLKSLSPSDVRATATWAMLTRADISDLVNVKAGYGGGTGMLGAATADDYYIEGLSMRIEPANTGFDYVELNLEVSPAIWSMDTHGVF